MNRRIVLAAGALVAAAVLAVAALSMSTHPASAVVAHGTGGSTAHLAQSPTHLAALSFDGHVDSTDGAHACHAYMAKHSEDDQLQAEYDLTAGVVNKWDHSLLPHGTESDFKLNPVPPSAYVSVCYIVGRFAVPVPAGTPVPDRIVVALDDGGTAYQLTYGFSSSFPMRPAG